VSDIDPSEVRAASEGNRGGARDERGEAVQSPELDAGLTGAIEEDPLARVAGHGLWAMGALLVPGIYSLFLVGYLVRELGPTGYAPWATTIALLGWLTLLDAGLSSTTTREAARAVSGDQDAIRKVRTANAAYSGLGAGGVVLGAGLSLITPLILGLAGAEAGDAWLVGLFLAIDTGLVIGTAGWIGTARGARRFDVVMLTNTVQVAVAIAVLLALLPSLGLVGAAIAQPIGRVAGRGALALILGRLVPWFRVRVHRPTRAGLRELGTFSLPIVAIQVANQLGIGADVLVVGAISGATAAGTFAAGSQFVRYLAFFLFPAIGVVLPAFSAAAYRRLESTPALLVRSLLGIGLIAGTLFGGVAIEAESALTLWIGSADPLAVTVMRLYALTFAIIAPAHVMILMLIARNEHRLVGVVVLAEAAVNLLLSLVLIGLIGPAGVAVSTLVVVALDDVLIIPFITSRKLRIRLATLWLPVLGGLGAGAAIVMLVQLVGVPGVPGAIIRGAMAGVLLLLALLVLRKAGPSSGMAPASGAR
jgi:O-antigen/teichoic acid export membrane protein